MEISKAKKGYLVRIIFSTWLYIVVGLLIIYQFSKLGMTGFFVAIIPTVVLAVLIRARIKQQKTYIYEIKVSDSFLFAAYLEKSKNKAVRIDTKKLTSKVLPLFPVKGRWILKIYKENKLFFTQTNDFDWKYEDLKDVYKAINSVHED